MFLTVACGKKACQLATREFQIAYHPAIQRWNKNKNTNKQNTYEKGKMK